MNPLSLIDAWPVDLVAAAVVTGDADVTRRGPHDHVFELASISKIVATWAMLVAVEEGSITLGTPVGQSGCTLGHLLSHAGGYGFNGAAPIAPPGTSRIYSNTGIELAAAAVEQATGIAFARYLAEAILDPLAMTTSELVGSPAHGVKAPLADLVRLVGEITRPTLLSRETVALATSPQFAELNGMVPGVGSFRPCPWGLGVEIHGEKRPHWMGVTNSAATFGHFGGGGSMMWIDPLAGTSLIALTDRRFDDWAPDALRLWPQLSDAVIAANAAP